MQLMRCDQVLRELETFLHGKEDLLVEGLLDLVKEAFLEFFVALVQHFELVGDVSEDEEIAHLLLEETLELLHCHIPVLDIQLVSLE